MSVPVNTGIEPPAAPGAGVWQRALIWNGADAADRPLLGLGRCERLLLNLGRCGITEVAWARASPEIEARLAASRYADRLPARVAWNAAAALDDPRPILVVQADALFDLLILPWFARQIGTGLGGVLETSEGTGRPVMASFPAAAGLLDCADFETAARRAGRVSVAPPPQHVCLRVPTGERPRSVQQLWPLCRKAGERWMLRQARRWTFPLTAALASRRADPNTVTWASFWIGVAGAALLAFGGYGGRIAGAALLYGSWIADCLDGGVSRLTYQASAAGARLDTVLGRTVYALTAAALGWTAFAGRGAWKPALAATVLMIAGGFLTAIMARRAEAIPAAARSAAWWRLHLGLDYVLHRDNMIVLVVFAALDSVIGFIWLALVLVHLSWMIDTGVVAFSRRVEGDQA